MCKFCNFGGGGPEAIFPVFVLKPGSKEQNKAKLMAHSCQKCESLKKSLIDDISKNVTVKSNIEYFLNTLIRSQISLLIKYVR